MQKIISKYALAAHLALMAVAPLFLLPFFDRATTATVMLWLSAFGFIWLLMEPSRRRGEMPHDARARVGRSVLVDPLFWLSLVLVAYVTIRALNGGIGLAYDAELMNWKIRDAVFPLLPGVVDGEGYLPFASVISLSVIIQGMRHALGRSARVAFMLVGSVLSALAALILAFAISYGHPGVLALTKHSLLSASFFGTAFGLQFLCGLAALVMVVVNQWMKAEPLAALGLIGNAIGLVVFSPPIEIAVFFVAFLILAIISFALARKAFEGSGSFRCSLAVLMALVAPVLYAFAVGDTAGMSDKIEAFRSLTPFPDGFVPLRDALSAIALKTWKANPWLGTGLGTFPLDLRFTATQEDWAIVSSLQRTTLNGWWQLLVERGVIGALMIAAPLGMLIWTYLSRLILSFSEIRMSPEHFVGPLAMAALVALAFVDCSFLRPEVLLLAGTFLAFSGGAFPSRRRSAER